MMRRINAPLSIARKFSTFRAVQRAAENEDHWEKKQPDRMATQFSINYGHGMFQKGGLKDKIKEKIEDWKEELRAMTYGTGEGVVDYVKKDAVSKKFDESWKETSGNFTTTQANAFLDDTKDWAQQRRELGKATFEWDQDSYKLPEDREISHIRMGQEKQWREGKLQTDSS